MPRARTPLLLSALVVALASSYRGGVLVRAVPGRPPHWVNLACSGDGQTIAGAAYEDGLLLSRNGGLNWTTVPSVCAGSCGGYRIAEVTVSNDGRRMIVRGGDKLYVSTNAGVAWAEAKGLPALPWQALAVTSDGQVAYTIPSPCTKFSKAPGGQWCGGCDASGKPCDGCDAKGNLCSVYGLYASSDAGATWSLRRRDIPSTWKGLATATGGSTVFAYPPGLWVSTDSGATFTELQTQPSKTWSFLAVRPEAGLLAVGNYADQERNALRLSWDLGKTWPQRVSLPLEGNAPGNHTWHDLIGMAASKDGSTLLLVSNYGWLYRSLDRGATWNKITSITPAKPNATVPTQPAGWEWWSSVAMSDSGMVMYAAEVVGTRLLRSEDRGGSWRLVNTPVMER